MNITRLSTLLVRRSIATQRSNLNLMLCLADSPPFSRTSDIDTSSGFISGKQASSQAYLSSGLRISHQMAEPNILLDNPSKAIPQRHLLGSSYTDIFSCLPGCFQSGDPRLISCGTRVLGALLHWSTSQFWTFSSFYNDTDYQFVPKYTFFFLPSIDRKNSHDFFSKYSVQAFKAFSKYGAAMVITSISFTINNRFSYRRVCYSDEIFV